MNDNFIMESFENIMPQFGLNNIRKHDDSNKLFEMQNVHISITVNLFGDINGNIVYILSSDDAKKMASIMMMGMSVEEFNEMAKSAISELTNMLTAHIATNLSKKDICVDISTPVFLESNNIAHGDDGNIYLNINVDNIVFGISLSF